MANVNRSLLLLTLWLLLTASAAQGQIVYGKPTSANLRLVYTSWETKIDGEKSTLNQFASPLLAYFPLRENFEARLFIAGVNNSLSQQGQDFKLAGLTDLRVQLNHAFSDDRILVSLGVNAPTGKTGLNFQEDWVIMNYLSNDFLTYPNRRLGSGLGVNAMLGGATMAGKFRLGLSVTYQYNGSYEAYENNGTYKPGNHASIIASAQRSLGQVVWLGDLTFMTYGDDTQDERVVYNRGDQFIARLGGTHDRSNFRLVGNLRYFFRGRNAVYDPTGALDYQLRIYGNEFAAAVDLAWYADQRRWEYGPLFDVRLIQANEVDLGNATAIGVGARVGRWLGPRYKLGVTGQYFTGEADGGAVDLGGFQVMTSLSGLF